MRLVLAAALVLTVAGFPVAALATDVFGAVKSYDSGTRILILDNGMEFGVDDEVDFHFTVGTRIRVSYSDDHGIFTAYAVVPALIPPR